MPKATNTSTTATTHMPSVYALGCARAAVNAEFARADDGGDKHKNTLELLTKQEEALDDLIATLPAMTLADAAVQLGVACTLINVLATCEWKDLPERLEQLHDKMERLLLSAMPFVAEAADIDVTTMYWQDHVSFRTQRFGLEEAAA